MNVQERIYALMEYYGRGKSAFAEHVDISMRVLNVYYHRPQLSRAMVDKILLRFPEVNRDWLENGTGAMLDPNIPVEERVLPTVPQNLLPYRIETVNLNVPFVKANTYIKVDGFGMEPTICNGDIIGVRTQQFETIDTSRIYMLVVDDESAMIKRIVSADEQNLYLADEQTQKQPFTMPKSKVKGLYRVVFAGRTL